MPHRPPRAGAMVTLMGIGRLRMMLMEPLRCSCERGGVVAWVRESPGLVSVAESPGYRQADVGATNAADGTGRGDR